MKYLIGIFTILSLSVCETPQNNKEEYKDLAEQLFLSVYGEESSNIDKLVSDEIVSSYPIFEELFNKKAIRGREAYKDFAIGFSERWKDAEITIHETIAEGDKVVLLWSFSAKRVNDDDQNDLTSGQEYNWGGITLFRFDKSGKITAEIGEESSPGPFNRLE